MTTSRRMNIFSSRHCNNTHNIDHYYYYYHLRSCASNSRRHLLLIYLLLVLCCVHATKSINNQQQQHKHDGDVCLSKFKLIEFSQGLDRKMINSHQRFRNFPKSQRKCILSNLNQAYVYLKDNECQYLSVVDHHLLSCLGNCIQGLHIAKKRLQSRRKNNSKSKQSNNHNKHFSSSSTSTTRWLSSFQYSLSTNTNTNTNNHHQHNQKQKQKQKQQQAIDVLSLPLYSSKQYTIEDIKSQPMFISKTSAVIHSTNSKKQEEEYEKLRKKFPPPDKIEPPEIPWLNNDNNNDKGKISERFFFLGEEGIENFSDCESGIHWCCVFVGDDTDFACFDTWCPETGAKCF